MSDKRTLIQQVQAEILESKRKKAKAELRQLLEEHSKAESVKQGVQDRIADVLREAGEDESSAYSLSED
jgi:hypothetical protein